MNSAWLLSPLECPHCIFQQMNVFFRLLFKKCIIKQLLNSVFAWYHELSKSRVCVICLSLRLRQITQTRGFDNSWYHAQPHPIIVYYYTSDSLWKIWLVESIQSIHNSLWTWHDKCNICCRYYIYQVKFNVCLVTKPLECSQKQNGWTLRFCFWGWIMWKMYNKTIIEFELTSCLCYLPQPSASADNTDLGFDNSWYHAQPHPIIVYYYKLVSPTRFRLAISTQLILASCVSLTSYLQTTDFTYVEWRHTYRQ